MKSKTGILVLGLILFVGMVNACSIDKVYFKVGAEEVCAGCVTEQKDVIAGNEMELVIETSGCDGKPVKFVVYQDVVGGGDIPRREIDYSEGITISGDRASARWTAQWIYDNPVNPDPEYFLKGCVKKNGGEECKETWASLGPWWNIKVHHCIKSAEWSELDVTAGTDVDMEIETESSCNDLQVDFRICEKFDVRAPGSAWCYDPGSLDGGVEENYGGTTIASGEAKATWAAEWMCDGLACSLDPPEYYFVAQITKGGDIIDLYDSLDSGDLEVHHCIKSAEWSELDVTAGTDVDMEIETESSCNDLQVDFRICEHDQTMPTTAWCCDFGSDDECIEEHYDGTTIASGEAKATWAAEWMCDGGLSLGCPFDPPEYYFVAQITKGSSVIDMYRSDETKELLVRKSEEMSGRGEWRYYEEGYIRGTRITIIDETPWLEFISDIILLGLLEQEDEVEIQVLVKNIDSTPKRFKVEIFEATNSSMVEYLPFKMCSPSTGNLGVNCIYTDPIPPGENITINLTTDWNFLSLPQFKGIPIIKLYIDGEGLVEEKVIPIYYENLTIFHESDDELRRVSDPFGYTHRLILDEECKIKGGDFCVPPMPILICPNLCSISPFGGFGEYYRKEWSENPIYMFANGVWDMLCSHINTPLTICQKEKVYGIVDADLWQDIETKLPNGNSLHYLLNQQEYSTYESRTCKDEDWKEDIVVHQAQYKELIKTFFEDEEFYEKVRKLYKDKLGVGLIEAIGADRAEAMANQIYCFKTHLKDTRTCYALNYEWYSLTDTNPIGAPLGFVYINGTLYQTSYIKDIRRWNYDQEIDELV